MFSQAPYTLSTNRRPTASPSTNGHKSKISSGNVPQSTKEKNVLANFCAPITTMPPAVARRLDKSVLLEKLGSIIQELQFSSACRSTCQGHTLTYANQNVKRFCRLLDFILSFGLKRSSDSYWPLIKEFSSKGQIDFLLQTWKPKSNRSRALSWLYQCLNDGLLEFQMQNFARSIASVQRYYAKSAYVWEAETLETVAIFLRGLENVTFRLISIDQANQMQASSNGDLAAFVDAGCPEHQRVVASASNGNAAGASSSKVDVVTPAGSNATSVVKVSPSRKIPRHRGMSVSSVDGIVDHSFETSVADFSECPHVLGLTPELQDRMLLNTDLCVEAADYNFPPPTLGSIRASNIFVRKKSKVLSPRPSLMLGSSPTVRSVVVQPENPTDHGASMENSLDVSFSQQDRKFDDRIVRERQRKVSELDIDPDTMLKEILSRPRVILSAATESPVMSSTPVTRESIANVIPSNIPEITAEANGSQGSSDSVETNKENVAETIDLHQTTSQLVENSDTNGAIVLTRGGFPVDTTRVFGNGQRQSMLASSLPNRSFGSMQVPAKGAPATATDFEKQIWQRLHTVSDLMATYSDSMSEHSVESENTPKVELEKKEVPTTVIEKSAAKKPAVEFGEIQLESGDMLNLAVHIFTKDGEQFAGMYRIYLYHHFGTGSIRHLLLTNYALYVLSVAQIIADNDSESPKPSNSISKYSREIVVPYSVIDYISVGVSYQLFNVFTLQKKEAVVTVCTCCEELTNSILSKLEFNLQRFSSSWSEEKSSSSMPGNERISLAGVISDATPQKIALKKWLCGELGKEDVHITRYSLVYWNPNAVKCDQQSDTPPDDDIAVCTCRSGYLYAREYYPTGWIRKQSDWKQSYFMLRGKKLYQFEDSSCKVGERVFDLKEEISDCRQIQTKDYPYCMEMSFLNEENKKVQLSCQTKHELQQWLYAFAASFSQMDAGEVDCECVSCSAVVAASHLVLGQESSNLGFIRTLAVVRFSDIVSCHWCCAHCSVIMEFSSKIEYSHQRWLLSFSCEAEMRNFIKAMTSHEPEFNCSEISIPCSSDTLVCAESSRHWSDPSKSD